MEDLEQDEQRVLVVKRVCSECPEPYLAKGFCKKHYAASRYLATKDRQRETGRAWTARNREHVRTYSAAYHANRRQNPETRAHVLELDAKSRERKRELKGLNRD